MPPKKQRAHLKKVREAKKAKVAEESEDEDEFFPDLAPVKLVPSETFLHFSSSEADESESDDENDFDDVDLEEKEYQSMMKPVKPSPLPGRPIFYTGDSRTTLWRKDAKKKELEKAKDFTVPLKKFLEEHKSASKKVQKFYYFILYVIVSIV